MASERTAHRTARTTNSWGQTVAVYLRRRDICPRCDARLTQPGMCTNCLADLTGDMAETIQNQSEIAATALIARDAAIANLAGVPAGAPRAARQAPGTTDSRAASATATSTTDPASTETAATAPSVATSREGSQISVQSVLAVAGAALLGVAAIVFTFLNPDLTNFATRTTIIAVTTAVFLAGALLLVRARLRFSAEAIGALGLVFVALDIWAFSHGAPPSISPWVFVGIGTAFSAAVLITVGSLVRLRTWVWLGVVGLASTPAWFGYAVGTHWSRIVGYLGVVVVALATQELLGFIGRRMSSPLRADRWALTAVQLVMVVSVLISTAFFSDDHSALASSAVYGVIALLAFLGCRNSLRGLWSFIAGAAPGLAIITLVGNAFGTRFEDSAWVQPVMQAGLALVLVALASASRLRISKPDPRVSRLVLLSGALSMLGIGFFDEVITGLSFYFNGVASLPSPAWTWGFGLAAGILVTALGVFGIWLVGPRRSLPGFAFGSVVISESIAVVAFMAFAGWDVLPTWAQVAIALLLAGAGSIAVTFVPKLRRARPALRVPVLAGAHLLVIEAASIAWTSPLLSEIGGAAVVLLWVAITAAMPRAVRPVHTGIGFAYALVVFAHVIQLAHLSDVAILSLTAALASASALMVTLLRRIPLGYWYAILIVTAVPFVLGVGDVLVLRSGWTGLSTGVTFALALTLVLSTRRGLSRYLRATAAALLVPALAVVVVDLGAQLLVQSASPVTLPAIAVIVACVLPSTNLIGAALVRRRLAAADARLARLWIEVSTLVTGALAVILALVRAAAGLNTSFLVLVIIGIGAAATALVTHRRYGWIVAAASWTGALWSFWGILGVNVIEPYVLPPAIAASIIGAIAVIRRLPGVGLYSVGLVCAVVPTLAVLAAAGNGGSIPWRTLGLIGGAILLVALGAVFAGRPDESRLRLLASPALLVGVLAAAGGAVQAVRVGLGLDLLWLHPHAPVMTAVLELSVVAAALGTLAARTLLTPYTVAAGRSRWAFMPAAIFLVVGPICAVRSGWLSTWTLLALSVALLALLVVTVARAKKLSVGLPPVWFSFALAWCTAVAGWSTRLLRVEAFSLPLGLALLAAGIIVMIGRCAPVDKPGVTSWPLGFTGSWRLLTPGIVVTFLPSILATATDPQTQRAVLVIGLALVAILIGSLRKLGAPFILGIVVLPIENITVFAAQIGHTISATSWWITLATAGAVLLVIAVTYERRTSGERGVTARIRDLR